MSLVYGMIGVLQKRRHMTEFARHLDALVDSHETDKQQMITEIIGYAEESGYTVADVDKSRPWGGFVRFAYKDGDTFIREFFPDINPTEARLGNPVAELSPKVLLVAPKQRLSWQVHARRAERWRFLNDGGYHKSTNPDKPGELITAHTGDVVQFEAGECHRLVGADGNYTLVAEIWQHTDPNQPSDEADITRFQDDYKR